MLIGEIIRVAIGAIRANKMRAMLTMLGIIIGIAAVITMVALGEGAQRQVQAQLQSLGTNVLTVRPGAEMFGRVDRGETLAELSLRLELRPGRLRAERLLDLLAGGVAVLDPPFLRFSPQFATRLLIGRLVRFAKYRWHMVLPSRMGRLSWSSQR
jgi:hypothetical protein